jgi:uncharacterized protein (TIGR02266 family)
MPAPTAVDTKTVVVADDTAFVRDRFRLAIESAGHRAVTVASASELLATLRTAAHVDLVVLDLRLPQARGLDVLRAIARLDRQPPIVVFSGTIATAAEVRELAALGVAGYINEYSSVQHIIPSLAPHLFPKQYNRRGSPRVVLGVPVTYRVANSIAGAVTLNVSTGGLAIRTTSPLEKGTSLKVRFRVPGWKKEIDADARVAWSDKRMGMGLQFTRVAADDQTAINGFVEAHFFSNRKA